MDQPKIERMLRPSILLAVTPPAEPDVPTDDIQITLVQPDKPLPGVFTVADPDGIPDSGDETKVQFSQGNLASHIEYGEWGIFPNQYDCMNTVSSINDFVSLYSYGSLDPRGPIDGGNTTSGSFDETNDFGMNLFPGQGWRMLSAQEWCYLMGLEFDMDWADRTDETNPRRNLFRTGVEVMGCNCIVLYPDNYQGTKNETFTTESDYLKATEAGIVFLPLAGYTTGNKPGNAEVDFFGEAGYYWSHTNAGWDSVYSICFLSPTSGDSIFVIPNMVRRSYYSIRLVKDY